MAEKIDLNGEAGLGGGGNGGSEEQTGDDEKYVNPETEVLWYMARCTLSNN